MHRTIRLFSLIIALVLLAALTSRGAVMVPDPGLPDTVRIDTVVAFVSGSGVIPVRFYNDEPIFGIEVTLREQSADVSIDSFSFAGGRVSTAQFRNIRINADSSIITVSVIAGVENIPAGTGLLGKLYVSFEPTVLAQTVPLDTVTWDPDPLTEYRTRIYLPDNSEIMPRVVPGALILEENPPTFDSVWVNNTEAYPGQPLALDVYVNNERPVLTASIALTWGTSYLTFDSARFTGTRSNIAQTKSIQYTNSAKQVLANVEFTEASPLPAGSGVLVRLYFKVKTAPDTSVTIDTVTFQTVQNTYLLLTAIDGNALITPIYHAGTVHINQGTDVNDNTGGSLPTAYALTQNYPNPFNPTTIIKFALPRADHVQIEVYDILGRTVRTLVDEQMVAGVHTITFDGRSRNGDHLATGIYFYRMSTSSFAATRKMLLMK